MLIVIPGDTDGTLTMPSSSVGSRVWNFTEVPSL